MSIRVSRKGTDVEIRVQTLRNRLNPALIVVEDGSAEVVANFKSEYAARLFVMVLTKLMKGEKHGTHHPDRHRN